MKENDTYKIAKRTMRQASCNGKLPLPVAIFEAGVSPTSSQNGVEDC